MNLRMLLIFVGGLSSCVWSSTTPVLPGAPAEGERLHLRLCDDAGVCINPGVLAFVDNSAVSGPSFTLTSEDVERTSALQETLTELFPDFQELDIACDGHPNNVWVCFSTATGQ